MKTIFAELLKRAFTNGNGGFISIRDENDEWDWKAFGTIVLRLALILLTGAGAYYIGLL